MKKHRYLLIGLFAVTVGLLASIHVHSSGITTMNSAINSQGGDASDTLGENLDIVCCTRVTSVEISQEELCVDCDVTVTVKVVADLSQVQDDTDVCAEGAVVNVGAASSATLSISSFTVPFAAIANGQTYTKTFQLTGVSGSEEEAQDTVWASTCFGSKEDPYTVVEVELAEEPDCIKIDEVKSFVATVKPASYADQVQWEITPEGEPCGETPVLVQSETITYDTTLGTSTDEIHISEDSGTGKINVRAYIDGPSCSPCEDEKTVNVTCCCQNPTEDPCEEDIVDTGSCEGGCDTLAGSSGQNLSPEGNPVVKFNLGHRSTGGGGSAGSLYIRQTEPSLTWAQPSSLEVSAPPSVEVLRGSPIRQVKAPEALADVITINDFKYEINYYLASQVGATNGQGYYEVTGDPYVKYIIENPEASTNDYDKLRISRIAGSKTNINQFAWDDSNEKWLLSKGNDFQIRTYEETWDGTNRLKTMEVQDSTSNTLIKAQSTWYTFPWGEERTQRVNDPDNYSLTTRYSYYTNAADTGKYTREYQTVQPDGRWTRYDYNTNGLVSERIFSYQDAATNAPVAQARVREYDYTPVDGSDDGSERSHFPRTITEKIKGKIVSREYHAYFEDANGAVTKIVERAASTNAAYGDSGNLRTTTEYYGTNVADCAKEEIKTVKYPDGRQDSYEYAFGLYSTNADPALCSFALESTGTYVRATLTHGLTNSTDGVADKTTRDTWVKDKFDRTVQAEKALYNGSDYDRFDWSVIEHDSLGRVIKQQKSNGTSRETIWACCGKESETDETGKQTDYTYNALGCVDDICEDGMAAGQYPAQADKFTSYTYDAAGRKLTTTRMAGSLSLSTSTSYDSAGRISKTINEAGQETTYAYSNGGRTRTVVEPGGLTTVTDSYLDGRTKSVTVDGVLQTYYDYGSNDDATQWAITYTGPDGTNSTAWSKTVTDMLGRSIRTERPAFNGSVLTNTSSYNTIGQLVKTTAPGQADTLYEYDNLGQQTRSGLDMDGDGTLDLGESDRVSENETYYETDASTNRWQVSVSKVYATDGSSSVTTNSISKTLLTGLSTNLTSKTISIDIRGNQVVSTSAIDPDNKKVTQTVTYPDSTNDAVTITVNGLTMSSKSKTGLEYTYSYDDLGRRVGLTDPRVGTSSTYYNTNAQVAYVEDAASNKTYYVYDADTGRQIATTNALGKISRQEFDLKGQLIKTWGETAYPVSYAYDDFGRMTNMSTYRGGTSWDGWNWPASPGTADTTIWKYDEATGLLTNKLYADGNGTAYSYTDEGKLETRTWARGITTTYSYDDCCGAMTNINYSDSTPDVAFTFDRLGRQSTITDGQGTRSFYYDSETLALTNETLVAGGVTSVVTRTQDSYGRASSYELAIGGQASSRADYQFDELGRLSGLVATNAGVHVADVQYNYLANSDLVQSTTLSHDDVSLTNSRTYEASRNLITEIHNQAPGATISKYEYANDALGRRTQRIDTLGVVSTNDFAYNTRSELTGAEMNADSYGYIYDNIGNRTQSVIPTSVTNVYLANQLNQYTNISNGSTLTPTYDDDGNMLTYNGWTFTWNGENRLVTASNGATVVHFAYDYMGRRYQKSSGSTTNTFTYDGWALIRESDGSSTNSYVYGMDLSGSMQGAGTIGGLLATVEDGDVYFSAFDANGNLTDYVDDTGSVVAHYDFDPYGNVRSSTGAKKDDFAFRFSTKYLDDETGLYYYGYRYYDSNNGRWPSRDPIGEMGGLNLYAFIGNRPVDRFDKLGLWLWPWKGCCDGKVYNRFKQCCCCKGKTCRNGGSGCDLLDKKKIPTGIKRCCLPGRGLGKPIHCWVEIHVWSAGFYPNDTDDGGMIEMIEDPRYTGDPKKDCKEVELSPCKYDINKVKAAIKAKASADMINPPDYILGWFDCRHWSKKVIKHGLKQGKGKCEKYP